MAMIYNTVAEVPLWGRPTVQKLIDIGVLGGSSGGLGLTQDMLRLLVIHDRLGLYDK